MNKAIYPGTFDPITLGHLDIIQRAVRIFDAVVVAVVKSSSKETLFSFEERLAMVKEATEGMKGVEVQGFTGLVVDFAKRREVNVIVRGLRMISDFEYEFQMALTNRRLNDTVETIFLMPHPEYSYISSRLIKEAAQLGANLKEFLPEISAQYIKEKLRDEGSN